MKHEELLRKAVFGIEIKIGDKVDIKEEGLDFDTAKNICETMLKRHSDNEKFSEKMASCLDDFGFSGYSGGGISISIDARLPFEKTDILSNCREYEIRPMGDPPVWERVGDDLVCSYCGSASPDTVLRLIKKNGFGVLSPSTKGYKWYLRRASVPNAGFGAIKYYRWHDTPKFIEEYNKLVAEFKEREGGSGDDGGT